jgi:hypothetical protein
MYLLEQKLCHMWKAGAYVDGSLVLHKFCEAVLELGLHVAKLVSSSSEPFHVYQTSTGDTFDDDDADRMANVWEEDTRNKNKFHQAGMGDHLMIPFKCGLCVFRKLFFRNPMACATTDVKGLAIICRMILDAFWSCAALTMEANTRTTQRG